MHMKWWNLVGITSTIILGLSCSSTATTAGDVFLLKTYPQKNATWFFSGAGGLVFDYEKSTEGLGENRPYEHHLPTYGWHFNESDDNQPQCKKCKTDHPDIHKRTETFLSMYKIHLMPKPNDFEPVVERVVDAMLNNCVFEQLVDQIKITVRDLPIDALSFKHSVDNALFLDEQGMPLPFIVIYANPGKAQQLVEQLDPLLATFQGIQLKDYPDTVQPKIVASARKMGNTLTADSYIASRFSIPATTRDGSRTSSLIYYAQGNADNKFNSTDFIPGSPMYTLFKSLVGKYPEVRLIEGEFLEVPLYCSLYDPTQNGALVRADYMGNTRDFHLYLPDCPTI